MPSDGDERAEWHSGMPVVLLWRYERGKWHVIAKTPLNA